MAKRLFQRVIAEVLSTQICRVSGFVFGRRRILKRPRVPCTQNKRRKFPLAKHYDFVMIGTTAVHCRSPALIDGVDCRSPVERAAATFVPDLRRHYTGRTTLSAAEFFAALGSFKINSLTETSNENHGWSVHRCLCAPLHHPHASVT